MKNLCWGLDQSKAFSVALMKGHNDLALCPCSRASWPGPASWFSSVAGCWERGPDQKTEDRKKEIRFGIVRFCTSCSISLLFSREKRDRVCRHSHTMRQSQQEVNHTMFTKGMQGISSALQTEHIAAVGLITPVSSGGKSQVLRNQNLNYFEVQASALDWLCQGTSWTRTKK